MSADCFAFEQYAGSGRGLMARPRMPTDVDALREHISAIEFEIYNMTDGGVPVTGELGVDESMFDSPRPWGVDKIGHTFLHPASGAWWPLADKVYRIIITFIPTEDAVPGAIPFFEVWQVTTKKKAL